MDKSAEEKQLVVNINYELFVLALVVMSLVNWVLLILGQLTPAQAQVVWIMNVGLSIFLLADFAGRIIVVDDCSSDETYRICQNFNCHLLRHPVNLGQGAALQTGMEYALRQGGGDYGSF